MSSGPSVPTPQGERERLRAIAEAATPGEWVLIGDYVSHDTGQCNCGTQGGVWGHEPACSLEPLFQVGNNPDSRFVAAFNPRTVLALLDRLDELEATP